MPVVSPAVVVARIAVPISCAACCWSRVCSLAGVAREVLSAVARSELIWARLDWVVPDRSLNFGWMATWPVTVAPASMAACLTPEITVDEAPGSVTSTIRSPGSSLASSLGSAVVRNVWLLATCCCATPRSAFDWSSSFFSEFCDVRRTSIVLPCSSVERLALPPARQHEHGRRRQQVRHIVAVPEERRVDAERGRLRPQVRGQRPVARDHQLRLWIEVSPVGRRRKERAEVLLRGQSPHREDHRSGGNSSGCQGGGGSRG